jgi:prophage antirepressor-like protein
MRLTNIQKRAAINEFLARPGSEVKTVRQVVKGLESEGIHISDTLVKAVREERELSPPVEPTPLFKPEVIEVDKKSSICTKYTNDEKAEVCIPYTSSIVPVINSTQVQQFTFPLTSQTVRIVIGERGEPWWVATDVCRELGHVNAPQAISRHCKKDGISKQYTIDKMGRQQEVVLINEANLYRLINRSNTLHAETFQDWVCEEVLPSIRKTGGYGQQKAVDPFDPEQLLIHYANKQIELSANVKQLETKNVALVTEVSELEEELEEALESLEYFETAENEMLLSMSAKAMGIPPGPTDDGIFQWGRKRGLIYYRQKTWTPQQKYLDAGWFTYREEPALDYQGKQLYTPKGQAIVNARTRTTTLGRIKIRQMYREDYPPNQGEMSFKDNRQPS